MYSEQSTHEWASDIAMVILGICFIPAVLILDFILWVIKEGR